MIKKDLRTLWPAILFTSKAQRKISAMPVRYTIVLIQPELSKNAPANSAITGILAPQGMKGASMAVALRSRSFRMVRLAIIPGTAQPMVMTKGMTDFPESPTFLKMGSSTTATLAIYPHSSKMAMRKYITMTRGKKPITAITPPMMPSTRSAESSGEAPSIRPPTHPWKVSSQATSASAMYGPTHTWEIWNTSHMTAAKMGIPSHLFVRIASILSLMFFSLVRTLRTSTSFTIPFTNSKRLRSAASTAALSVRSILPSL